MSPQPQLIVPSITDVPSTFVTSLAAKAPWMTPTRPHWTLTTTTVPAVVTSTVAAATTSTTTATPAAGTNNSKAKYVVPIAVVIIIAGFLLFLALDIYHTRRQARRTTAKIQHLQWWSQRQEHGPSHAYGSDEDGGSGVRRGRGRARTRTGDVAFDGLPRYADIIGPNATRYGGPVVPPAYHSMISGERRYFGGV